jgi:hypothetical protein
MMGPPEKPAMETTQHSFTAATVAAHRDVLAALRAMPQLAWAVVFILMFQVVLGVVLAQFVPRNSLFGREIPSVLFYALLTPSFIAVHRFVILGEVTRHYRLQWEDRRFQLFFCWAFTMFALSRLALLAPVFPKHWTFQLIAFGMAVAVCVLFTRVTILFPAIAVDAPGASPAHAFEDTKGHGWYIFFLFLISPLPSLLLLVFVGRLAIILQPLAGWLLVMPLAGLAGVIWLTMAVVLASRLYQSLGNRLNQPI